MAVNVRIRNGIQPSAGIGGATEGDIRGDMNDIIESLSGVVDVTGGHALVHEATSPAMTVVVDKGVVYVPNDSYDEFDSDSIKFWELVISGLTAARTLSITSNSSGQTRIDRICAMINPATTPDETASNIGSILVVVGTPGAGEPDLPAYHTPLAKVTVANGETEITNTEIVDERVQLVFKSDFLDLPTDLVTETDTQTLTNKRITKRITLVASDTTPNPDCDTEDIYGLTALAGAAAFQAPAGTPTDGQSLILRIKDDGTGRALTWDSVYRVIGVTLPTTTTAGKTIYVGCIYNVAASKWDVVAVNKEV